MKVHKAQESVLCKVTDERQKNIRVQPLPPEFCFDQMTAFGKREDIH